MAPPNFNSRREKVYTRISRSSNRHSLFPFLHLFLALGHAEGMAPRVNERDWVLCPYYILHNTYRRKQYEN
ncbi:hypothetical protein F5Y12DRAFT_762949 [Xylaria sp. FL1777]|nr:hypothetical protein F5Y12DRAFT_762949 [Xylaria sp. FL1777]